MDIWTPEMTQMIVSTAITVLVPSSSLRPSAN